MEFSTGHDERVLVQLPELDQGQEAVPVTLVYEPATDAVLISLFSGELQGDPTRKGIDFADKAGQWATGSLNISCPELGRNVQARPSSIAL